MTNRFRSHVAFAEQLVRDRRLLAADIPIVAELLSRIREDTKVLVDFGRGPQPTPTVDAAKWFLRHRPVMPIAPAAASAAATTQSISVTLDVSPRLVALIEQLAARAEAK